MSTEDNQEKLAQFEEFFSIEHEFSVNITPLPSNDLSYQAFEQRIPIPFKIASDVQGIDQSALRPLQALSGVAGQLVEFLNHQSQKIDLLVGYILSQQDDDEIRYQGIKFGGGGLIFSSSSPFELNQKLEMKLFFIEENTAVFCHGEVVEVTQITTEEETAFHHKIVFDHIREEDREILVRTSLHQQSRQLQALAKERNKKNES